MAAFQWPLSKLDMINSALSQNWRTTSSRSRMTARRRWNAASPAYERALAFVCEDHPWDWLTDVRLLVPSPTPPDDDQYDTAYPLPADLVHLIMVRLNDVPCVWDIFNNQIVVNARRAGRRPRIRRPRHCRSRSRASSRPTPDPTFAARRR